MRMRQNRQYAGNILWYVPNHKKAIAFSTVAVRDYISSLSREHETIWDVYDSIVYDNDAKRVLRKYIDRGYGNEIAKDWFG